MSKNQDDGINAFQTFSTLLALLLPLLQFFFNFLPATSQNIFVIKDILAPVSIIAGVFSYLLIIAFKNTSWFNLPFNLNKHKEYQQFTEQLDYIKSEPDVYRREAQARNLFKNPKKAPFYLTPLNVYVLLIPILLITVIGFLSIGIFGKGSTNSVLILIQAITYILSVSITTLTLAVFYINETNRKNQAQLSKEKYQKIIHLLVDNNSVPEFPRIEFVAQNQTNNFSDLSTFIRINDNTVYNITTDFDGNILKQVFKQTSDTEASDD